MNPTQTLMSHSAQRAEQNTGTLSTNEVSTMEQEAETNEVLEEFDKAKAEGRQPSAHTATSP